MTKIPKVPETREETQVQQVQIPIQIFLHEVAFGINKLNTPMGIVNEFTFLSPSTGIAVTLRLNEEGTKELIKQATGVETATAQDLRNLTGI